MKKIINKQLTESGRMATDKQRITSLAREGNLLQSRDLCIRLCRKHKSDPEAWFLLGAIQSSLGNNEEAVKCCRKTVQLDPTVAIGHFNLATALASKQIYDEAITEFQTALRLDPSMHEVYLRLSVIMAARNQLPDAIGNLRTFVALYPENVEAQTNLGKLLLNLDQADDAIKCFSAVVNTRPDIPEAYFNLGNACRDSHRLAEAETHYRHALELNPRLAVAHNNLGLVVAEKGNDEDALIHFQMAIEADHKLADAYINTANILRDFGKPEQAAAQLNKLVKLDSDNPAPHWDRALLWLSMENFEEGWHEYEWRLQHERLSIRDFPQPIWKGQDISTRTLLVTAEQGIGDEIMFASCFPDIISTANHVVIDCDRRLQPLFQRSFPTATVHGNKQNNNLSWLKVAPAADYYLPAGSLPLHFRNSLENFRDATASYLVADNTAVYKWQRRYAAINKQLNVGISWRGGHISKMHQRSTSLKQWRSIITINGINFINLQYGETAAEIHAIQEETGTVIHDWDDADPLQDMDDFAAQISALDLVISVDNSTVHLAGSLGVKTWVLLPFSADWRWSWQRSDSYWYKSLRLFRQIEPGNWDNAILSIKTALIELLQGKP